MSTCNKKREIKLVTNVSKVSVFQYINEIEEIVKPLKKLGITYFCYSESTTNGALLGLLNNGKFADFYLKNKYYQTDVMAANHTKQGSILPGLYLWDTITIEKFQKFTAMAKNFDMHHGCSFIQMDGDIKRAYNFATNKQDAYHMTNIYLNNFHLLQLIA